MTEHIKLDEKQEQFIKKHFLEGVRLFDRVEEFKENAKEIRVVISTAKLDGIAVYSSGNGFTVSYPDHVIVHFHEVGSVKKEV